MAFFELFGGVVLFGILWLFVPRTSFVVALGLYLHYQCEFFLRTARVLTWGIFFEIVAFSLLITGVLASLVLDIRHIREWLSRR